MKIIWRNIHLWLGLAAGLIFFIECLSGTLLVFEDELTFMAHKSRYQVAEHNGPRMDLDLLLAHVGKQYPKTKVTGVKVYQEADRTLEVSISPQKKQAPLGKTPKKEEKGGQGGKKRKEGRTIFVDPYTGKITGELDPAAPTFFSLMLKIHMTLLAGEIGKTILGISTFMVFTILVTGIILWFPKKKKQLKAKLKVKTDAGWKRLNHDLHIVMGFYCTFFLLILLITSLSWSFQWANKALYTLTGSKPADFSPTVSSSPLSNTERVNYQQALNIAQSKFQKTDYWAINMPKDEEGSISVTSVSKDALHRNGFDNLSIDQRSGEVLKVSLLKDMPGGWQLRRYMKPVHTGAIGGLPTKVLAFLVSLISASFPITGTILWLNRIRKKKGKNKKQAAPVLA